MRHSHLFVRAEVKRPLLITERASRFMCAAVALAEMKVIAGPYSVIGIVPGNEGVTSVVALDFSSATLHEWVNTRPYPLVHFDLYTCGKPLDEAAFKRLFEEELDPITYRSKVIDRDKFLRLGTS